MFLWYYDYWYPSVYARMDSSDPIAESHFPVLSAWESNLVFKWCLRMSGETHAPLSVPLESKLFKRSVFGFKKNKK